MAEGDFDFGTTFGWGFWGAVVCVLIALSTDASWPERLAIVGAGGSLGFFFGAIAASSGSGSSPDCRDPGPDDLSDG